MGVFWEDKNRVGGCRREALGVDATWRIFIVYIYVYNSRGCEQACGVWWLLTPVGLKFAWCSTEDIPRSGRGLY